MEIRPSRCSSSAQTVTVASGWAVRTALTSSESPLFERLLGDGIGAGGMGSWLLESVPDPPQGCPRPLRGDDVVQAVRQPGRDLGTGPQAPIRRGIGQPLAQIGADVGRHQRALARIGMPPVDQPPRPTGVVAMDDGADPGLGVAGEASDRRATVALVHEPDHVPVTAFDWIATGSIAVFHLVGREVGDEGQAAGHDGTSFEAPVSRNCLPEFGMR